MAFYIDDFTTGIDSFTVGPPTNQPTLESRFQRGDMLGKVRSVSVYNASSPQGSDARLVVGGPDRLRLQTDPNQYARVDVGYGWAPDGPQTGLGVNLLAGGADRLRVTISALPPNGAGHNIIIYSPGKLSSVPRQVRAGVHDFLFADFADGGVDLENVSHIQFTFDVIGGLTLDSVEVRGPRPLTQFMTWRPNTRDAEKLAVHAALLHTNKIVYFGGDEHDPGRHFLGRTQPAWIDSTRVFDCATGSVERVRSPQLPVGTSADAPSPDLFCCGHAFLGDGSLLVAGGTETWTHRHEPIPDGGHEDEHHRLGHFTGLKYSWIFHPDADPQANPWTKTADMFQGRWYPTLVTLGDGSCLVLSGHPDQSVTGDHVSRRVEVFDTASGQWSNRGTIPHPKYGLYPRLHLLRNGEVFSTTAMETPDGRRCYAWHSRSGDWRNVAPAPIDEPQKGTGDPYESYNTTSVLLPLLPPQYEPRIMVCGGARPYTIKPLDPAPTWTPTGPRQPIDNDSERRRLDGCAVILPTAEVLLCGGIDSWPKPVSFSRPVRELEVYDPQQDTWTTLPASGTAKVVRGYHSVALLMPDGRVFTAGGGDNGNPGWSYHIANRYLQDDGIPFPGGTLPRTANDRVDPHDPNSPEIDVRETAFEIYEPPYYTRPDRPTIQQAPTRLTFGATFDIATPDAVRVHHVALVRAGSVTHAFDPDQRYVGLRFTRTVTGLRATVPDNSNIAPPGTYMLFIVAVGDDGEPVPSRGAILQLGRKAKKIVVNAAIFNDLTGDDPGGALEIYGRVYARRVILKATGEIIEKEYQELWKADDDHAVSIPTNRWFPIDPIAVLEVQDNEFLSIGGHLKEDDSDFPSPIPNPDDDFGEHDRWIRYDDIVTGKQRVRFQESDQQVVIEFGISFWDSTA